MKTPKGKHVFGTVTVGTKGQIVIPKKARDLFGITPGDTLLLLGDETQGLAIITNKEIKRFFEHIMGGMNNGSNPGEVADETVR